MTRSRTRYAAAIAALTLFGAACSGDEPGTDRPAPEPAPLDINWTEADFAADFASQTAAEQIATCDWFWSVSQAQYNDMLFEAGYLDTQVINSWNVLVEACP